MHLIHLYFKTHTNMYTSIHTPNHIHSPCRSHYVRHIHSTYSSMLWFKHVCTANFAARVCYLAGRYRIFAYSSTLSFPFTLIPAFSWSHTCTCLPSTQVGLCPRNHRVRPPHSSERQSPRAQEGAEGQRRRLPRIKIIRGVRRFRRRRRRRRRGVPQ